MDVILRRLDDDFCDPLELRGDSLLGVPGSSRRCAPATSPWPTRSAAACSRRPALLPFLPRTVRRHCSAKSCSSRRVATWWCGEPQSLRMRHANLDRLVVKPTFPLAGREPVFGAC